MVASEMLSVRQDAMFGAGHAKWGGLDPSLLVLRPRPAAVAFARAWQATLRAEAMSSAARSGGVAAGWAARAPALLKGLVRRGEWPGLEEARVPGMRQNSR
jgi:hypothetical protein